MMNKRALALIAAKRLRMGYPPPAPLSAPIADPWSELAQHLQTIIPETVPSDHTAVKPGQFRFIKTEYGVAREGRHYSPPLLFTLTAMLEQPGHIQVAQVYPDPDLAAPGDLILTQAQTGLFPLIIESWNIYSVPQYCLGPPVGAFRPELVEIIRQLRTDPQRLPDWALWPRPLLAADPRLEFRQLEQTVAEVFASAEPLPRHAAINEHKARLLSLIPGLTWPAGAEHPETVLATAVFPDEYQLLAAADAEAERFTANLVSLKQGEVVAFRPVPGHILMRQAVPGGLGVTGRISDLPPSAQPSTLLAFLTCDDIDILSPETIDWDYAAGRFYLFFRAAEIAPEQLAVAVLLVKEDDDGERF